MSQPTKEIFLSDVANHKMRVMLSHGVHRHLRFNKPGTMNHYFDLVTWPGYLSYSGDMGHFVFARTADMFEFFWLGRHNVELDINPGYWSEKLQAIDRADFEEFDKQKFKKSLEQYLNDVEAKADVRKEIRETIYQQLDEGKFFIMNATFNFRHGDFQLLEFLQGSEFKSYTYHFIWACYAIVWGIRKYHELITAENLALISSMQPLMAVPVVPPTLENPL